MRDQSCTAVLVGWAPCAGCRLPSACGLGTAAGRGRGGRSGRRGRSRRRRSRSMPCSRASLAHDRAGEDARGRDGGLNRLALIRPCAAGATGRGRRARGYLAAQRRVDVGVGLAGLTSTTRWARRSRPCSPARRARSGRPPPSTSAPYSTTAFSVSISASGVTDGDCLLAGDQPGLAMTASVAPASTLGHPHHRGHQRRPPTPRPVSRPATTSSVRAIAARSSTFEMLGRASAPVTRCTGWSSQSKKRRWISSASQPP